MKKIVTMLLGVAMAAMLCACGANGDYVYFQNDTGATVDGFYISATTADSWGERLNRTTVKAGGNARISVDKLAEGAGVSYDIGAIDENSLMYEVYDVPVNIGDTFALAADGDTAVLTVTDAEGNTEVYEGYTYVYEG